MEYDRGPFSIRSRPSSADINDTWTAYPADCKAYKDEKLPFLMSKSQDKIHQMVDFVLDLPMDERPEGSDANAWNKLLEERGIIP